MLLPGPSLGLLVWTQEALVILWLLLLTQAFPETTMFPASPINKVRTRCWSPPPTPLKYFFFKESLKSYLVETTWPIYEKNWVGLISTCSTLKGPAACSQADINKVARETGGVGQSPRNGTKVQRKGSQRKTWKILDWLMEDTPIKVLSKNSGSLPSETVSLKLPIRYVTTTTWTLETTHRRWALKS